MKLIRKFSPYLLLILLAFAQVADTSSLAKSSRRRYKTLHKSQSKSRRGDVKFGDMRYSPLMRTIGKKVEQREYKIGQLQGRLPMMERSQIIGTPESASLWLAFKNGNGFNYFELLLGFFVTQFDYAGPILDSFWTILIEKGLKRELETLCNLCHNEFKQVYEQSLAEAQAASDQQITRFPTTDPSQLGMIDLEEITPAEFSNVANICDRGRCNGEILHGIPYYLLNAASTWQGLKAYANCTGKNVLQFITTNKAALGEAVWGAITNGFKDILKDLAVAVFSKLLGLLFKPLSLIVDVGYAIYKFVKQYLEFRDAWRTTNRLDFYAFGKTVGEGINIIKAFIGRRRKLIRRYKK